MPPAANRKPARVKVKLTADWDNQHQNVVFDPSSRIWSPSHKMYRFNKIKEGMKESDYHEIEFVLEDDNTGLGLRLPQDPKDAFWVKRYVSADPSHCPDANDVSDYSVFEPVSRAGDTTLIVNNYNDDVEKWCFTINFVKRAPDGSYDDADKANYVAYDPIGDNQNFHSTQTAAAVILAGVGGVVVGVAGTLGFQALTG